MKKVNFQCVYDIPDCYTHAAVNHDGSLNGFRHPPIRDRERGQWQDSVDGSWGEIIFYDNWETAVKAYVNMTDMSVTHPAALRRAGVEIAPKTGKGRKKR